MWLDLPDETDDAPRFGDAYFDPDVPRAELVAPFAVACQERGCPQPAEADTRRWGGFCRRCYAGAVRPAEGRGRQGRLSRMEMAAVALAIALLLLYVARGHVRW